MTDPHIEVLCCPLAAVDAALFLQYESLLSDEELQRLRRFRSPTAAQEFLVGRALLRTALAARLACAPRALAFQKNADGKPSLAQPSSPWQFNLTHSHGWIALALCESGTVGIDIESHTRGNNLAAIAQRYFSAEENARLAQCRPQAWLDYFFAVWTLKEAHAKALGCALPKIFSCSSFAVDLTARTIESRLRGAAASSSVASWLYRLDENVTLAAIAHGERRYADPRISRCVPLGSTEVLALEVRARGF